MNLMPLIVFAGGMGLLALSPGPGLAAVLSRSLVSGFGSGLRVVLGLIIVDFLFLAAAVLGLSAVSQVLGPFFQVIKYAAAAYLVIAGWQLIRSRSKVLVVKETAPEPAWNDVLLGAVITLGNPKAILFYSAFLPAFFDIHAIGVAEYFVICAIITVVSFSVYAAYILIAAKSLGAVRSHRLTDWLHKASGATLIGTGLVVATR